MVRSKIGDVKIFHFRNHSFEGAVENTGGATFAFVKHGDCWKYTSAHCSPRDNFSRKIGRAIAVGRLESNKGVKVFGKDAPRYEDVQALDEMEEMGIQSRRFWDDAELPQELRSCG